jgi:hypothetical protein
VEGERYAGQQERSNIQHPGVGAEDEVPGMEVPAVGGILMTSAGAGKKNHCTPGARERRQRYLERQEGENLIPYSFGADSAADAAGLP